MRNFSERPLELPVFTDLRLLAGFIAGTVLIGILAGLYPAGYLSSFQAVKVLKGSVMTGKEQKPAA